MNEELLKAELKFDEGTRLAVYKDSMGILSIGVGHNLQTGISQAACDFIFAEDLQAKGYAFLDKYLPWWRQQPDPVARTMVNLAFQLEYGLLGFHSTLAHLKAGQYPAAAISLWQSKAAKQCPNRYRRHCLRLDPNFKEPK